MGRRSDKWYLPHDIRQQGGFLQKVRESQDLGPSHTRRSWTEDGEMLAAKVIEYPEARHTRFVWEGMRLLQEIGPAPDAEGKIRQNGNARVRSWIYEPDGTGYVPLAAMDQALGKHGVGKARCPVQLYNSRYE